MNDSDTIRESVREHYAGRAREAEKATAGSKTVSEDAAPQDAEAGTSATCCGPASAGAECATEGTSCGGGYTFEELSLVPGGADLGLGCGNPTMVAELGPGETVLDLGSGAGIDCFLAARRVGPEGRVIGVDMTDEMLHRARENAANAGFENVDFRKGYIEELPVEDATVDVIVSNCVVNLSPDKERVFAESFRVLKPGGRLAISDLVAHRPFSNAERADAKRYSECITGAETEARLLDMMQAAGFVETAVDPKSPGVNDRWNGDATDAEGAPPVYSAIIRGRRPR